MLPGGGELKLEPQVRAGIAINPYSSLTLTADVDATSNKTFVPGVKSQLLSLGVEQTILSEFLSFRVGAFKNMQDAATPFVPTAGLGLRWFAFRAMSEGDMTSAQRVRWFPPLFHSRSNGILSPCRLDHLRP